MFDGTEPRDPETDRLAREVAKLTGESPAEAIRKALSERLARERLRAGLPAQRLNDALGKLAQESAALPDLDMRSPDEVVGYDEWGLWR